MPTYGKTATGASWQTCENVYVARTITLPGSESVVNFYAYLRSQGAATREWRLGLWDATDESLDYQSDVAAGFTDTTGAWRTASYSGSDPAADTYWLGILGEGIPGGSNTIQVAYDSISSDIANYQTLYYSGTWSTLENPLPIGDDYSGSGTHDVSIYLETAAAGGATNTGWYSSKGGWT